MRFGLAKFPFVRDLPSFDFGAQGDGCRAWITWPDWPVTNPEVLEQVALEPERTIWRDVNVVISPQAAPETQEFLDFLVAEEAQALMASEGWVR